MPRSDEFLKMRTMTVPKRSGFNKSFQNLLTLPIGKLIPLMCDELIPNTRVSLKTLLSVSLPPLASSTFMRVKCKVSAFFVPMRILYGGFESWYCQEEVYDSVTNSYKIPSIPVCNVYSGSSVSSLASYIGPGSLADYLGYKFETSQLTSFHNASPAVSFGMNLFPFLAYHRVWDSFYRNSQITKPIFSRPFSGATAALSHLPYQSFSTNQNFGTAQLFCDGSRFCDLRPVNFDVDYFTSALPSPQQGNAQKVTVVSNEFTIASLRAANSLQMAMERSSAAGFRLIDNVKAHFGAYLSEGQAQMPIYLGSGSFDVYSKGIYQNSENATSSNNPFNSVASEYGSAFAGGKLDLIDDFTAQEPGYLMVMVSIVPRATYSTGVLRQNYKLHAGSTPVEMGFPALQNVGNQPIYAGELNAVLPALGSDAVFGYTDRFAEYMTREDECHGLLRDGESLEAFALQRSGSSVITGGNTSISTLFLNVPETYLDQVAAASSGVSNYGAWIDSFLDYKVSMPLHQYSTPSLQDPAAEHGHVIKMERGGQKLN